MTERELQKQLQNYHKTQIMPVELAVELLTDCGLECMYEDETREALEMAIEALSAEPCEDATLKDIFCMGCEYKEQEPCEDAISRQAVLDKLENLDWQELYLPIHFKRILDGLPSVKPKQKMGHWENGCCSECGCDAPAYIIDWKWQKDMDAKFCPMCGARMAESEENNG